MIKIKELRTEFNLTQKEFAQKLNVDAHNVGDWERGKGEPNSDMISKIAISFHVSSDYLLGLEDEFGTVSSVSDESGLSKDELKMISEFRLLSIDEQNFIRTAISGAVEKITIKK